MAMEKREGDGQVAVLIDFENVGLSSIQWLFDQISDVGRIIVKRAYADWSDARKMRDQLLELGIEPIHLFRSAGSGKNSSDIRMTIDAVDLLYVSPVDTFVVVSSDADFVPLVSKLRSAGKAVIGAGRRAASSRTLVISCDRYYYLDQGETARVLIRSAPQKQSGDLLVRGVKAAMDEQGTVTGSKLYQRLQRLDPSFDFRALGYSTFTRYLDASSEVKVVRPSGKGDITVELVGLDSEVKVVRPSGKDDITVEPVGLDSDVKVVQPSGKGDIVVEPVGLDSEQTTESTDPAVWAPKIDAAWSRRSTVSGRAIYGTTAAADAAKVLGVAKLSVSRYRTLQRLLAASSQLAEKWLQQGNRIVMR